MDQCEANVYVERIEQALRDSVEKLGSKSYSFDFSDVAFQLLEDGTISSFTARIHVNNTPYGVLASVNTVKSLNFDEIAAFFIGQGFGHYQSQTKKV